MNAPEHHGFTWRTSSVSGGNGNCVEIGWRTAAVAVRDSKNTTGPVLDFPPTRWHAFLTTSKST
jgi:hypothetical protein